MSSRDVEDLVVRARPEGLEETTEQFGQMEEGLDDTAGAMDETAGGLQTIQNRMQGAMGAIVAGVAVATGFLLTQVPIIGELVAGFGAILEVLGFRLDGLLRPALGGVVDQLFEWANALAEADGPLGTLLDGLLVAGTVLATLVAGFLVFTNVILPIVSILGTLVSVGGTVVSAIVAIGAAIAGIISLPALLVAAIAVLIAVLLTDFMGLRTRAIEIIAGLVEGVAGWFSDLHTRATGAASEIVEAVVGWFRDLRTRVGTVFGNLTDDAVEWGQNLINSIVQGVRSAASSIGDALDDLPVIGDLIEAGASVTLVRNGGGGVGGGGGGGGFGASRNITQEIFMSGRRVDEAIGRFGKDAFVRR